MSAAPRRLPVLDAEGPTRPATRGDCVDGERPCPWASCSHHAIHGVLLGEAGSALTDDELAERIESLAQSCTLDVADRGDATLEDVGDLFGVTRERIRQIEAKALKRVRWPARDLRSDLSEDELPEASAPKPVPVAARRIDWMGDGESQSRDDRGDEITTEPETDHAPAAMGAEETAMATAKRSTTPRAAFTATGCPFPGCNRATHTPTTGRRTADPLLAQMCQEHRRRVRQTACERVISVPEAMAWLSRDRSAPKPVAVAKPVAPKVRPTAARHPAPAPAPAPYAIPSRGAPDDASSALIAEQRAQIADLSRLLAESQARAEALRADRDELVRERATRADATSPQPLARLAKLGGGR